ncbi:hypothetical protein PVAG01_05777 [Phlyctema vagabunda]|uniref:2EXR domain-containing protein n=1 Tax=Phlyctema vagabunda TaxID=108571 RepID=A0ABR4PE65_9HELO
MFTLFSALPPELRDQIWENTFEPRLITFKRIYRFPVSAFDFLTPTNVPPPIAFSICRESRNVALARYQTARLVAGRWHDHSSGDDGQRYDNRRWVTLRWDPEIDAIHVPQQSLICAVNRLSPALISERNNVRTLVVSVVRARGMCLAATPGLEKLFVWKGLRDVVYVDDDEHICPNCVEGEGDGPAGCTGTHGCVTNPRTRHGMSRKAWNLLVEIDKLMSGWLLNPSSYMRWRYLRFKVVSREDQIFTSNFVKVTKESPFGSVTRYSLYLPEP